MKIHLKKTAVSVAVAASALTAGLTLAGGTASAAVRPAAARSVATACSSRAHNYAFPRAATAYRAGSAGTVTVAPVNGGAVRVKGVHPARGWRAYVDSSSGSSVDVYFHSAKHRVAFEAEINDWGGLTVTVTAC
jgi:hypothetical protein